MLYSYERTILYRTTHYSSGVPVLLHRAACFYWQLRPGLIFSRSSGKLLASAVLFSHTNSSRLTSSCPTVQYCCKFALGEAKLVYYCKADQSQCEESLLESRTISLPRMLHKALTPYSVQYEVLKSKLLRPLWTPYNECLPPDESNLVHFV